LEYGKDETLRERGFVFRITLIKLREDLRISKIETEFGIKQKRHLEGLKIK
tara:strand:- start:350 stop:502 length:153 start_codon:yes stop_codon:yes gene_type:complete